MSLLAELSTERLPTINYIVAGNRYVVQSLKEYEQQNRISNLTICGIQSSNKDSQNLEFVCMFNYSTNWYSVPPTLPARIAYMANKIIKIENDQPKYLKNRNVSINHDDHKSLFEEDTKCWIDSMVPR